jgi:hypothetical protein
VNDPISPLLTDAERTEEADRLSEEELRFIVAALINHHGPVFDGVLLDLKRRPSGLEEVTH